MSASLLPAADERLQLVHTKGEKVAAIYARQPLFDYRYTGARPKSYVHPLYLPNGQPVCVDGPGDHVHLRGLMVAWSGVNGVDFWGEVNPGPPHGQIVHQRFEHLGRKPGLEITSIQHWIAQGKVLMVERRTLKTAAPLPEGIWLEWTSEFRADKEPVTLSAQGHVYNGLGLRFLPSMTGGKVLNAKGTATIERANGEEAAWCTYYGALDGGRQAGVAIFDHPGNPRHPTPFFVMNKGYGYLSAAPTFRQPFQLRPGGEPLRLRWAVLSYLDEPRAEVLDRLHKQFAASVKA
ncbi:MAG TPA: PmoA family protein [Bryobacteraceae bacterium]|nr:PmoA family protein [Bryobacteraceae bacterium]